AVRVALCSATGSPKSAAQAQPSQSVQLAPARRCAASKAVRCRFTELSFTVSFDKFVQSDRGTYTTVEPSVQRGRRATSRVPARAIECLRGVAMARLSLAQRSGGDSDHGLATMPPVIDGVAINPCSWPGVS